MKAIICVLFGINLCKVHTLKKEDKCCNVKSLSL